MTIFGLVWREQSRLVDGLHPTLRKGAKDGAPCLCRHALWVHVR
jgi:hypothetical protein